MKEAKPGVYVYADKKNGQHLIASGSRLHDAKGEVIARNAIETAALIRKARNLTVPDNHQENLECGKLLVRLFGEERAQAAALYAHRDIHREDIKAYKMELQNAALEKNSGQKIGETNS